jgi:hypothetical protein
VPGVNILSVILGQAMPPYVVEAAAVGIMDGGERTRHVVVLPIPPEVVTIMGVIAYVDVLPAPTERVGKEHGAPSCTCQLQIAI